MGERSDIMGKEFQKEVRGHTLRQVLSYFTFEIIVFSYVKATVSTNCWEPHTFWFRRSSMGSKNLHLFQVPMWCCCYSKPKDHTLGTTKLDDIYIPFQLYSSVFSKIMWHRRAEMTTVTLESRISLWTSNTTPFDLIP